MTPGAGLADRPQGTPFQPPTQVPPSTSLVIVSHGRPAALALCLKAVALMDHPEAEVIVVADTPSLPATAGMAIKTVAFDTANISMARNLGLAQAAGEVVAFLDDDAIPEPDWLFRISLPFLDPRVDAAAGAARGRDGMSWQFRAGWVDPTGTTTRFAPAPETRLFPPGPNGQAISALGATCAFRRRALAAIGGFRSHHRYHLDETDVCLRLAQAGGWSAVVPEAEVIHGAAASARRTAERVTTDLTEIGASAAAFWRSHAASADLGALAAALCADQRRRLIAQMLAGTVEPGQVEPILSTLDAGLREGAIRPLDPGAPIPAPPPFLRFPLGPRPARVLVGRRWNQAALRARASALAREGAVVTLLLLSRTTLPHRQRFCAAGYWEQAGGLWGASHPGLPRPWHSRFRTRARREAEALPPRRRTPPEG